MHIQTHILAGWCIGNLPPLTPRQRLLGMIAAGVSDIDGLGILISREAYWDYHHVLGHCAIFGVGMSAALAAMSPRRIVSFLLYLALFHLHLALDLFGSGPGWAIYYLWPMSGAGVKTARAWDFYSWQNIAAAMLMLMWALVIAVRRNRTPLELAMPQLDRALVALLHRTPVLRRLSAARRG